MKNKIELFQELFATDPTSKIFYPLSKLYAENGMYEPAIEVLRQGLSRHPDHLEARMLLVEILCAENRTEDAADEVDAVAIAFRKYPGFWRMWAQLASSESKDISVALDFLSSHFSGTPLSWVEIIQRGLEAISGRISVARTDESLGLASPKAEDSVAEGKAESGVQEERPGAGGHAEPESIETVEQDIAAMHESPEEPNLRTKTMAELLVAQGNLNEALDIYEELLESSASEAGAEALRSRIGELRNELKGGAKASDPDDVSKPEKRPQSQLTKTLSLLAQRLEARDNLQ